MSSVRFQHEIKRELPSQSDQPVISGFGNNQDVLDVGLDASTTYVGIRGRTFAITKAPGTDRAVCSSPGHQQQFLPVASSSFP
jgi:hypothetical protein